MSLTVLPHELLIEVAHILDSQQDINHLVQTCKSLHHSLNPTLYLRNRDYDSSSALPWAVSTGSAETLRHAVDAGIVLADKNLALVHMAVVQSQAQMVTLLLQEFKLNPNDVDNCENTPFYGAATRPAIAKILLGHGADPSKICIGSVGYTPLHFAAGGNSVQVAKLLLAAGADVSCPVLAGYDCSPGVRPLHVAAVQGALEMVKFLLEHGADINQQTELGLTPLHQAIVSGRVETAEYLIQRGADIFIATTGESPWTPFEGVVREDEVEIARVLLEKGANPNHTSMDDDAPVLDAVRNGSLEMVTLLLDNGVKLCGPAVSLSPVAILELITKAVESKNIKLTKLLLERSSDGGSDDSDHADTLVRPLLLACAQGNEHMISLLIQHGADPFTTCPGGSALFYVAMAGHVGLIRLMLQIGLDINGVNQDGQTPLFAASESGHVDPVRFLLVNGADAFWLDNNKNTALHIAASYAADPDMLTALLDAGIDPEIVNADGLTPIHIACREGCIAQVKVLLKANVSISVVDNQGSSLLQSTIEHGHAEILEVLLNFSPGMLKDEYRRSGQQCTPLILAIQHRHADVVSVLLKHGVNLEERNSAGQGPLLLAVKSGSRAIIELLLKTGKMEIDQQDADGRTALFFAVWFGRRLILDFLLEQDPPPKLDIKDRYGATPLIMAARNGHYLVISGLLALLGRSRDELIAEDTFGHNFFYWVAQLNEEYNDLVNLVRLYAQSYGIDIDKMIGQESMVPFHGTKCLCDICGRATTSSTTVYPAASECTLCSSGRRDAGFLCCFDCVNRGATCRDENHVLEPHNCQCEDDEDDDDDDDDNDDDDDDEADDDGEEDDVDEDDEEGEEDDGDEYDEYD